MRMFDERIRETTHFRRMPILVLCALIITYCILFVSIKLGEYAIFIGGAIVGGLWSDIWRAIFREGSPLKKFYSLKIIPYIIIFIILLIIFIVIILIYPLK